MYKNNKIPRATAQRLPKYFRYFSIIDELGEERVNSVDISKKLQIDSATIRRDFSYFGELGKRGYGYDVKTLLKFFSNILNQETEKKIALVGVGDLGSALVKFNFKNESNLLISVAFDDDPKKIGKKIGDVEIYSFDEMKKIIDRDGIKIAILTVPEKNAQEVTDALVKDGIKGIINFTPRVLEVPKEVKVRNVNLSNEIETLIYFVENNGKILSEE